MSNRPKSFKWWAVIQDDDHLCAVFRTRREAAAWRDDMRDFAKLKIERVTVTRF